MPRSSTSPRRRRAKRILQLLGLGVIAWFLWPGANKQSEYVDVIFFDVGQGDGIAILSSEGKTAVVDGANVGRLRDFGLDSIDIAIASHAHYDHIGGVEWVIREMPVRYYMDNGIPHDIAPYVNITMMLRASDIIYLNATARTLNLGSATLKILPPPAWARGDQNNSSIGIVLEFGEFRALLTGDSEIPELNYFLELGAPDVTLLKAAHHGSRNGVSPAWLSATKPEVVVISCGLNNQYGHPDPWALRYYGAVASDIYRTDWHGDVVVRGYRDGSYQVYASKGGVLR